MSERQKMKAIIAEKSGSEVFNIKDTLVPEPEPGWVRLRVHAFGLNRSELLTRQGHSPSVTFPRILSIEAVGTVDTAPESDSGVGKKVVTLMNGMGYAFDGGYAE